MHSTKQWFLISILVAGHLAAMVFGDVRKERVELNEDTVWSGEKRDRSNPEASKAFPEVRRPLLDRIQQRRKRWQIAP